jgi:hypothetical protein
LQDFCAIARPDTGCVTTSAGRVSSSTWMLPCSLTRAAARDLAASHVSKHAVERPRHLGEIQRIDEQARVSDLPAAAAAHEAPKLPFGGPSSPRRLLLEGPERPEVSLTVDDLFHVGRTESPDQLVLQIFDADIEAEGFHVGASEIGAEARPLETAPEAALLCCVAETRQPDADIFARGTLRGDVRPLAHLRSGRRRRPRRQDPGHGARPAPRGRRGR